jgi:hypothetical protein
MVLVSIRPVFHYSNVPFTRPCGSGVSRFGAIRRRGVAGTPGGGGVVLPAPPLASKRQTHGWPIAQNEPNLARPGATDGGVRAKRSQTWGDWGMWAKAVVVWGVARPGSESCKTNPIWPDRRVNAQNKPNLGHRGKVSGGYAQPTKSRNLQNEPNFGQPAGTLRRIVQNEPNSRRGGWDEVPGAWAERQICKTKPISPERPGMGAGWRGRNARPESDCAK